MPYMLWLDLKKKNKKAIHKEGNNYKKIKCNKVIKLRGIKENGCAS